MKRILPDFSSSIPSAEWFERGKAPRAVLVLTRSEVCLRPASSEREPADRPSSPELIDIECTNTVTCRC